MMSDTFCIPAEQSVRFAPAGCGDYDVFGNACFAEQRRFIVTYCPKCGSPVESGSAFCAACGAPVAAGEANTVIINDVQPPPASPAMQGPPLPPTSPYGAPGMPPTPAYSASAGGGGGKAVLFALLGLLLIGGIVVLLLGFAVGPKWFTSGGGETEQEKVVQNFLKAMENKDAKLLISTIAPSQMEEARSMIVEYGYYDTLEEAFEDLFFSEYKSLKFEGVELKTSEVKGDKATVEVVKGKLVMVDSDGNKDTKDVKDSDMPVEFPLLKEGGKWYIDFENM